MNWFLRTVVDLFNALAGWYFGRKYGAVAKQLGRPPYEADGRRGFIILEVDGLAYPYLGRALRLGYMPYLARLLRGRRLWLAHWRCGLPSTTPASQAGIMYGNNWDIPGFRWYDKATGESVVCKLPGVVRAIQERISAGRAGLLRGGSSYTNLFDGDARLALFTLSAVGRDRLLENVRGLGFLFLFALSLIRIVKVIGLSLWSWCAYMARRVAAFVGSKQRGGGPGTGSRDGDREPKSGLSLLPSRSPYTFTFWGPLTETLNNIVFREVTTFSVMVDIYRGMPAIYASYPGYDEIAHHVGADGKEAFRALRGIDKQIRQIDRIRQTYLRREYDLYILSDHGLTPSVPFRQIHGCTLEQLIASHTGGEQAEKGQLGPVDKERDVGSREQDAALHFLLDELRGLEARPHRPLVAQLFRRARRRLEDRLRSEPGQGIQSTLAGAEWDLGRRRDVVVRDSGPLSHVYFNVVPRPMDLSEVVLLYPSLLEALTGHPGISLVVGREEGQVLIVGREGTLWVGPVSRRLDGQNPLCGPPPAEKDLPSKRDQEWAVEQLVRLARFPHSGDLILFGAWDGKTEISFEDQVATHGGLRGPQRSPFLASSAREWLSPRGIEGAEELYSRLVAAYGGYE